MKGLLTIALFSMLAAQATPSRLTYAVAPVPPLTMPSGGVVVLNVTIDPTGNVQSISTVAGASPFVEASVDAVRKWKFAGANSGSNAAKDQLVAFVYRPRVIFSEGEGIRFPETPRSADHGPLPLFISDGAYPVNSIAEGAVILDLQISPDGAVEQIRPVEEVPSLTEAARQAVGAWKFSPAVSGGKQVGGSCIAVISFLRPVV